MQYDKKATRYRSIYARLLRLYPAKFRERYAEGMLQTFNDLLRDRSEDGRVPVGYALWMFLETFRGIIKTNATHFVMHNKRIVWILFGIATLLLIPLIAMQFTEEMDWSLADFIMMGIMLSVAGLLFEVGARISTNKPYRIALATGVGTGFLLTWMNLAVGIIGSENNPANELYGAVILIGFFGVLLSGFKAKGMARAAVATAIAQFLVPIIALIVWSPQLTSGEGPGVVGVFILNSFFVGLWLVSARLFANVAQEPPPAAAMPQG